MDTEKRKKLKIAVIAPIWLRIPPKKYGGTEWIIYYLVEELKKRGHNVTLFASGDSEVSTKLSSVYPRSLFDDKIPWTNQSWTLLHVSEALRQSDKFDIIHSHVDQYDLYFTPFVSTPIVATMHNRLFSGNPNNARIQIYKHFHKHRLVAISHSQKKLALKQNKYNFVGVVYNGIDIKNFAFNPKGSDTFIWIARFSRQKGVENAIRAARGLGVKLKLAGRVDYSEKKYFRTKIKPFIDGKQIRYVGEISKAQKSNFFGNAKALLYPIEWDEPFGLVMAEALACGTPVIAYNRGSVPEIVQDKKVGFVVKNNIRSLMNAMKQVDSIDRMGCRKHVEDNFTIERMVDGYEDIYYKTLNRKSWK